MNRTIRTSRRVSDHARSRASARAPRPRHRFAPARLCAVVAVLLLGACSVFDRETPSASHFLLAPPAQAKAEGATLGSIVVRGASAVKPFDAQGFVYKLSNGQWRIDAYNGFLASPPDMVTEALVRACAQSGRFATVAAAGVATQTDLALETVVQDFYADFTDRAAPFAVVQLRTYVLDRRSGRGQVLRQLDGKASEPLVDGSPKAVVDALSVATAEAIAAIVTQLPASEHELRGGAR